MTDMYVCTYMSVFIFVFQAANPACIMYYYYTPYVERCMLWYDSIYLLSVFIFMNLVLYYIYTPYKFMYTLLPL